MTKQQGKKSKDKGVSPEVARYMEAYRRVAKPTVLLKISGEVEQKVGATRFGGRPDVPADFVWPTFTGKGGDRKVKTRPLSFLAQFNCADLASHDTTGLLPTTGLLSFFYELEAEPWGFDPADKDGARVYWFADTASLSPRDLPEDLAEDCRCDALRIAISAGQSYPSDEDIDSTDFAHYLEKADSNEEKDEDDWEKDLDDEVEALEKLDEENGEYDAQLLGWPNLIQGSIFEECALASRGNRLGSPEEYRKVPKEVMAEARKEAKEEWMLLFQLDSFEDEEGDFGIMFGDEGSLYFCIRKSDLAARRFDNTWTVMQCF